MVRLRWTVAGLVAAAATAGLSLPNIGTAQQPAAEKPPVEKPAEVKAAPQMVLKFYDISDLLAGPIDEPFSPAIVPPSLISANLGDGRYSGSAGGLFGRSSEQRENQMPPGAMSPESIINLIQKHTGQQESWDDPYDASIIDRMLVVQHSADVQKQVVELLEQIRNAKPYSKNIDTTAHWVLLKPADLPALFKQGSREIDPGKLADLPEGALYARSALRAQTEQTTTLLSGRARTVITDQEPSVGQNAAAFDPKVSQLLSGALVRMAVSINGSTANVTMIAVASDFDTPDKPSVLRSYRGGTPTATPLTDGQGKVVDHIPVDLSKGFDALAEIDRINVINLHMETTARLPLGKPILIGGMTLEPATGATVSKGDTRQLYLILQVDVADGDKLAK